MLERALRAFERRTKSIGPLRALELPVMLLDNFDALAEERSKPSIRPNPALYERSGRRILVNAREFARLSREEGEVVIAHEVAHDVICTAKRRSRYLSDDLVADLLVCRWGFCDELMKERQKSYGLSYRDVLELWPNTRQVVRAMYKWELRRRAGIA